ncbi:ABC transporter permease [Mycoplasma mycoides subsp. capri]|uniref:oligopeptide ABC transporter permease OppC n=1 Tax=Mycoplasma mycoides TaxID=2102 RepID=UPI0022409BE3|nr:oligopeptide ABC transporter permease OppC [Mycoplasma mycoides]UZK64142.1 ABC transporter permease [Mycoplasma mycoides subsp. capri]
MKTKQLEQPDFSALLDSEREAFFKRHGLDIYQIDHSLFKLVGSQAQTSETIITKPYSYWKAVGKILITSKVFIICSIILLALLLTSIIVPYGKEAIPLKTPGVTQEHPSAQHWFGLGRNGEDYWIEIWLGLRSSLSFAFVMTFLQLSIGIIMGLIWGYYRKLDILFYQLTSLILVIPQLILIIVIMSVFGIGYWPMILGIVIQAWIGPAFSIRILVLSIRDADYNIASITLGTRSDKIIRKNVLPKILPVLIQVSTFSIPTAIAIESTLAYFDRGFVDGKVNTSLGKILQSIMQSSEWQVYPHLIVLPILFICIISTLFFLVLKVFADSLDPKNHR